jgi:hypothetical protein
MAKAEDLSIMEEATLSLVRLINRLKGILLD